VESLSQSHNRETILSLLILFGKSVSVFPIGCCGHVVLDCVWLVGQLVLHSLQVREVVKLEEQVVGPMRDYLLVRECAEEGENSWKEPCSCHRAQRLPVRSVAKTKGKGG
jgi:hypothetical protein